MMVGSHFPDVTECAPECVDYVTYPGPACDERGKEAICAETLVANDGKAGCCATDDGKTMYFYERE